MSTAIRLTLTHRYLQIRRQTALSIDGPSDITYSGITGESISIRTGEGNANLMPFSQEDRCRPHTDLQLGWLVGDKRLTSGRELLEGEPGEL